MQRIFSLCVVLILSLQISVAMAVTVVPSPPQLKASSYLVMDYHSGELVVNENVNERVEPASLTKIMTVYVAAQELASGNISFEDKVIVSEKAWRMPGSRMFIEVNKEVTVGELLKGIIIQSGNDASVAMAEYIAGSEEVFSQVMNQYANNLGMVNTNFVNSTGLPHENHYTTAKDIALLSHALIKEFPDIYAMHSIKEYTYNGIKQYNRNSLLWRNDGVDGIKTGHTDNAGYCLVVSAMRGNMRLISVVLGTESENARVKSTQSLLSFAFRFFETHKLYSANEAIQSGKVWKGETDTFELGVNQDLYITIPRGAYKQLDASIELQPIIIAPIHKGDIKGTLKVKLDGKEIINQPLFALQSVGEGSFIERIKDEVRLFFE